VASETGTFGTQIAFGTIPPPESAYFVPACAHVLPNEGDGTCSVTPTLNLWDLPESLGCGDHSCGGSGAGNLGNDGGFDENCQHVDGSYGGGHFVSCKVVGFWHLDGSGVSLHDPTFSRTVWRLYVGAKGLVVWY
jgi:hypothetical protein